MNRLFAYYNSSLIRNASYKQAIVSLRAAHAKKKHTDLVPHFRRRLSRDHRGPKEIISPARRVVNRDD